MIPSLFLCLRQSNCSARQNETIIIIIIFTASIFDCIQKKRNAYLVCFSSTSAFWGVIPSFPFLNPLHSALASLFCSYFLGFYGFCYVWVGWLAIHVGLFLSSSLQLARWASYNNDFKINKYIK